MSALQFDEELFWLMTVYIGRRPWLELLAKGRQRNSAHRRSPGVRGQQSQMSAVRVSRLVKPADT